MAAPSSVWELAEEGSPLCRGRMSSHHQSPYEVYSPPARGRLIHLLFLALRPVQGSNVVGSQPVGQLETGLKIAKIVVHPESRASFRPLPRPPYPVPPPTPVLSELRDRGTIADNHWCCNAPQNPTSKSAHSNGLRPLPPTPRELFQLRSTGNVLRPCGFCKRGVQRPCVAF